MVQHHQRSSHTDPPHVLHQHGPSQWCHGTTPWKHWFRYYLAHREVAQQRNTASPPCQGATPYAGSCHYHGSCLGIQPSYQRQPFSPNILGQLQVNTGLLGEHTTESFGFDVSKVHLTPSPTLHILSIYISEVQSCTGDEGGQEAQLGWVWSHTGEPPPPGHYGAYGLIILWDLLGTRTTLYLRSLIEISTECAIKETRLFLILFVELV